MALSRPFIADEHSFDVTWNLEDHLDAPPKVAIVTPTYNRRKFIPFCFMNYASQTWPKRPETLEICILDDGDDCVRDVVEAMAAKYGLQDIVKYQYLPEKLKLGAKRNAVNAMVSPDVKYIVAFDDDDYYHPKRVQHAVERMITEKGHLAGATTIHALFIINRRLYQSGPFHKYHGTNGTMAYSMKYLKKHKYDPTKNVGEESEFTRGFQERMTQIDPQRTILCIAHNANTFEKTRAILKDCELTLDDFLDSSETDNPIQMEKLAFLQDLMDDPEQKKLRYQFARRGDELFKLTYDDKGNVVYNMVDRQGNAKTA